MKNNHCTLERNSVHVADTIGEFHPSGLTDNPASKNSRIPIFSQTLSPKKIARREAFLRLAGQAIAKHRDTTQRGYDGEHQFEIRGTPIKFPGLFEPGGPRMKSQQWERTNKRK